jgi:hypothetical protein
MRFVPGRLGGIKDEVKYQPVVELSRYYVKYKTYSGYFQNPEKNVDRITLNCLQNLVSHQF